MTVDKPRYARHLMADRKRSIPDICRELDDILSSTLYHYLHADGALKDPGRRRHGHAHFGHEVPQAVAEVDVGVISGFPWRTARPTM